MRHRRDEEGNTIGYSEPSYADPEYMRGHQELNEESYSTDDYGGTLFRYEHEIGQRGSPRGRKDQGENIGGPGQNYPFFTGGTIINPDVLPPVRTYHLQSGVVSPPTQFIPELRRLQGGRFVPAARGLLPPVRESKIQIDWEDDYHFGRRY